MSGNEFVMDIGLEVHIELSTASKIFCGCPTTFGAKPNTQVCPVCLGMPGSLPVVNRKVVEAAIRLGLALHCDIAPVVAFDRKNYFYPDNPQNYQISQRYRPICENGGLKIACPGGKRVIGIHEIHMEEDAGKLIHAKDEGITMVDHNRAGVPLLELVTEPVMHSAAEVDAFLQELIAVVRYLGISDCRLNEGSMRVDVNLSLRPAGGAADLEWDDTGLGVRTETKNLNSFRAVSRAIETEAGRQAAQLRSGRPVEMETRRWDDAAGVSYVMRRKETSADYRYFPEPDLPVVRLDENWVRELERGLVELPQARRERFVRQYGLKPPVAQTVTADRALADYYEQAVSGEGAVPLSEESAAPLSEQAQTMAEKCANWLIGDCAYLAKELQLPSVPPFAPRDLFVLVGMVEEHKISGTTAKETLEMMYREGVDPQEYVETQGLLMLSDDDAVEQLVRRAVSENPKSVADYRSGKKKAAGYLVGCVMKASGGTADPGRVREILETFLTKV